MADYYTQKSPEEEKAEIERLIKSAKERAERAQTELEMAEEHLADLEAEWRDYR